MSASTTSASTTADRWRELARRLHALLFKFAGEESDDCRKHFADFFAHLDAHPEQQRRLKRTLAPFLRTLVTNPSADTKASVAVPAAVCGVKLFAQTAPTLAQRCADYYLQCINNNVGHSRKIFLLESLIPIAHLPNVQSLLLQAPFELSESDVGPAVAVLNRAMATHPAHSPRDNPSDDLFWSVLLRITEAYFHDNLTGAIENVARHLHLDSRRDTLMRIIADVQRQHSFISEKTADRLACILAAADLDNKTIAFFQQHLPAMTYWKAPGVLARNLARRIQPEPVRRWLHDLLNAPPDAPAPHHLRRLAVVALKPEADQPDVKDRLLNHLASGKPELMRAAARSLADQLADPKVADAFRDLLAIERHDQFISNLGVHIFAKAGPEHSPDVWRTLAPLLEDERPEVVQCAAKALAPHAGYAPVQQAFIKLTEHRSGQVRREAWKVLIQHLAQPHVREHFQNAWRRFLRTADAEDNPLDELLNPPRWRWNDHAAEAFAEALTALGNEPHPAGVHFRAGVAILNAQDRLRPVHQPEPRPHHPGNARLLSDQPEEVAFALRARLPFLPQSLCEKLLERRSDVHLRKEHRAGIVLLFQVLHPGSPPADRLLAAMVLRRRLAAAGIDGEELRQNAPYGLFRPPVARISPDPAREPACVFTREAVARQTARLVPPTDAPNPTPPPQRPTPTI